MKSITEIEKILSLEKPFLKERFSVESLGYFGSYVRNEQHAKSDLDLLVTFEKPLGWEFFDLKDYLKNKLEMEIDLVTEKGLKHQIKSQILRTVKYIS